MNLNTSIITSLLLKISGFTGKLKVRIVQLIAIMLLGIAVSAQDVTPPVLINPEITCSSLDRINEPGCYRDALEFDGNSLTADVAALYTDPTLPVTATLLSVTTAPENSYCSWSYTYTFKIQDGVGNFVMLSFSTKLVSLPVES